MLLSNNAVIQTGDISQGSQEALWNVWYFLWQLERFSSEQLALQEDKQLLKVWIIFRHCLTRCGHGPAAPPAPHAAPGSAPLALTMYVLDHSCLSLEDPACSLGHQGVTRGSGTAPTQHSTRVTLAWGSLPKKVHQHLPWVPHIFSCTSTSLHHAWARAQHPPRMNTKWRMQHNSLVICFLSSQSSPEEASTPWELPGGDSKPVFRGWGWQSWVG